MKRETRRGRDIGMHSSMADVWTRKGALAVPHVRYVNVGAQPHVVCQVETWVVGILKDRDIVTGPVPSVDIAVLIRENAKVEAVEPETIPASTTQMEDVTTAKAAIKASVFKRMIDMEAWVILASIVADPRTVRMDVRSLGMSRLVGEALTFGCGCRRRPRSGMRLCASGSGSVGRNKWFGRALLWSGMLMSLRPC